MYTARVSPQKAQGGYLGAKPSQQARATHARQWNEPILLSQSILPPSSPTTKQRVMVKRDEEQEP